ncbi:MAG TPA: hypothetical protein VNM90_13440, partial [Haliangium sp.]|nr:hypothetical protein [Haliangium sp.]
MTELVLAHGFDCIPHLGAQVVLEELARFLQEIIRTGCIRSLDGIAARVGGDDDGLGSGGARSHVPDELDALIG